MTTDQRAIADPASPNNPVSPDFRPGLFVKRAPGPDVVFFVYSVA